MEYLRGSVNLRAYGQRDPLTEYRKEGVRLYKDMEISFRDHVFELLAKLAPGGSSGSGLSAPVVGLQTPPEATGNIGRNDPCPCGSGKKWKACGLKNTPEHQAFVKKG
jgi:preprotein translocase subunit SecA